MRVRPAALADAAGIADVQTRTWRDAYPFIDPDVLAEASAGRTERWQQQLSDGTPVWVAEEEGAIAGIMSAAASRDEDGAGLGEMRMLYVAPEHQGRGIGAALLEAAETELRRLGFAEAMLWVFEENARGRAFYERMGWRAEGVTQPDAWGPELRYRKRL
jgi:L-amino acid N-acyltransferase YncA